MEPFGYYIIEVRCYGAADYLVADHHQTRSAVLSAAIRLAADNNEEEDRGGPVDGAVITGYVPISHVVTS